MKQFQIFTDSTSDLEKKYREELEVDYLKMVFTINDKEHDADLDWTEIKPEDYYGLMRNGKRSITGLVKNSEVEEKFTKAFENGLDVLYIACSSKLSGSVNSAKIIADELLAKYPDRRIVCYDSLRSCYGEGLMAIEAAKQANMGKSLDEVINYLDEYKLNFQSYATVATLDWLKKAGRVKASTAFFGNLFSVKPIIVSDKCGNNYGYKKTKGRKASLDELVNSVVTRITEPYGKVMIEHADCLKDALYIRDQIMALKPELKDFNISSLGPIIGATTGPDALVVSFYGEKVTISSGE